MRYCTIPKVFGLRQWFEYRFSDVCKVHDEVYEARRGSKFKADWELAKGIAKRGLPYYPVAALAFLACQTPFGFWYWYTD